MPHYVDLDRIREDLRRAEEAAAAAIRERDELRAFLRRLETYAAAQDGGHAKKPTNGHKMTMVEELTSILQEADGPLLLDDIMERLQAKGRKVGGANPLANTSSVLSRHNQQFVFIKGRGWSLRAREASPQGAGRPPEAPRGSTS